MKPANASAMRSTSDAVSVHRHIRSPDELTLSLRPSQSRMSWRPIGSACDPDVKRRGRAGRSASGLAKIVPRAAATTVGGKFGWERSGQGDFVKLIKSLLTPRSAPTRIGMRWRLEKRLVAQAVA